MTPFALDHPAVQGYLRRLELATAHLPVDERLDIVDGIRSHLLTFMAEAETEADVHRALDALGSPEEIVGSPTPVPQAPAQTPPPPRAPESARGALEIIAVIFLLIGGVVVPFVGWVVGVVLLWVSQAWTTREKWLGTLVLPGGMGGAFAAAFLAPLLLPFSTGDCRAEPTPRGRGGGTLEVCSVGGPPEWLVILIAVVFVVAPIATAIYLLKAAGRRPAPTT